jgi:CspA family cold shock protein
MATGTIRRLIKDRGFGFIKSPEGKDFFFHRSEVQEVQFETLEEYRKILSFYYSLKIMINL